MTRILLATVFLVTAGEQDAEFITRTISSSPMTPASRVKARLTDCSLVIDQSSAAEKKRTVLPLARLDERSFAVVQDAEWGWFVEVHTQRRHREIITGTAKWRDTLAEFYIHARDQESAKQLRAALIRVVRSCHASPQQT